MAIYVKNNNDFEQAQPIVRECPHCGAQAPMLPVATPRFAALTEAKPLHAGLAFRCAACNEPRFARAAIRSFSDEVIVLSANLVEIERSKEHFQYSYLPQEVARLLREAFGCYTADLYWSFAMLCRRTIAASNLAGPDGRQPKLLNLFRDGARLSEIDRETEQVLEGILFGSGNEPEIDADQAAVLIEIIKDMFQQCYVRTAKLNRAIKMRRFFAGETTQKITPIATRASRAHSA
jgi:hypothetical protein